MINQILPRYHALATCHLFLYKEDINKIVLNFYHEKRDILNCYFIFNSLVGVRGGGMLRLLQGTLISWTADFSQGFLVVDCSGSVCFFIYQFYKPYNGHNGPFAIQEIQGEWL